MSEFKREERYIVLKRKNLYPEQESAVRDLIERLRDSDHKRFPYFDALMTEAATALTAEREVLLAEQALSDKLEKALKSIAWQRPLGRPASDVVAHIEKIALAALAEVARIREQT